ncbi:hypothetical protein E2C01_019178 [Portunus trituberculatus]|uniref:Uncharacterized protein n=1 Tax=Portunus trituberculatus TaxID=210409 RepID=A0A5B7DY57_PORTR|nr:hypothetical protein [Portunus trituberculatus]
MSITEHSIPRVSRYNFATNARAELYVGLVGVMEAVALFLVMPVTQRIGRRLVLGGGPFICCLLLLANLFLPEGG